MNIEFKINDFEGPLDLLLHLIKESKMDIFNIEIEEYEKLLYGTKENDFYIYRQKTDGTLESLFNLDVIQFENDNVIRLPQNKSCELRLKADNEILNAQVTILTYFKAI